MKLKFTKMQALGNDFVVLDAVRQRVALDAEQLRRLADRHFGVGCDQVLLVEAPAAAGVDFSYRIFNADGGEVNQCGNGARCFARFVLDQGLTDKTAITVATRAGLLRPQIEANGQVTVDMGIPCFEPADIPFVADARQDRYDLDVDGVTLSVQVLALGNPHAVQQVTDVDTAPVGSQGPNIERHPRFPERVNAGYMQLLDRSRIRLRVYERGSGETLACGSGACAAVVAGRQAGLLDEAVTVQLRGGELRIRWTGEGEPVLMTGPATKVFDGEIETDSLKA